MIEKAGYVPGETIKCQATLNNRSRNEIKSLTVKLVEQIFFRAEGGVDLTKQVDREVASIRYMHHIRPRTQTDWDDIRLKIPPVCASTNHKGHIIEVAYALMLHFEASGIHSSKNLFIPIVIGTEPFVVKQAPTAVSDEKNEPKKRPKLTYKHSLFGASDRLPYEHHQVRGDVIDSDAKTFRPRYPYFHHGSF